MALHAPFHSTQFIDIHNNVVGNIIDLLCCSTQQQQS